MTEIVPVHLVEMEETTKDDPQGVVPENGSTPLREKGGSDHVYGMTRESVERNGMEHMVIEPNDPLWQGRFLNIEQGERFDL